MKLVIALLMAGILAVSLSAIAFATGQQHWKLDSEQTPAGYQMERVGGSGNNGQTGSVALGPGACAIWLANEIAENNVTFSGGKWVANLSTSEDWSDYLDLMVGKWDGSSFTPFDTATKVNFGWESGIIRIDSQTSPETIPTDSYLALKICNTSTTNTTYAVNTAGSSELTSPSEETSYPTPEIAAGITLGVGLVALAGYVALRRRSKANTNA